MINSRMKLRQVFSSAGQKSIETALTKQMDWLQNTVSNFSSKVNIAELQKIFDDLFYPKNREAYQQHIADFHNIMQQEIEKDLEDRVMKLDLQKDAQNYRNKSDKISEDVAYRVIAKAYENLQVLRRNIPKANTANIQALNNLKDTIENLIHSSEEVLIAGAQKYGNKKFFTSRGGKKATNVGAQMVDRIAQLQAFNAAIYNGQNADLDLLGSALEEAVFKSVFSFQEAEQGKILEYLGAQLTGSNTRARGQRYNANGTWQMQNKNTSITVNISGLDDDEIEKLSKDGFTIDKKNFKATYTYNPNEAKMTKMDVLIALGQGPRVGGDLIHQLRFSIKNWGLSGGQSNSLGETNIEAALIRSMGQSLSNQYKFALIDTNQDLKHIPGDETNVTWIAKTTAHKLARMAIASDIIMGLNQGLGSTGGMANILLINTGQSIQLLDISDLVRNINEAGSKAKVIGYEPSKIESEAQAIYRNLPLENYSGRTMMYLGQVTSTLNKMKNASCTVKYNVI